jgi:polar amino acid transport system substrate-binding protein
MKKLFSLLLAFTLICSMGTVLSGCTKNDTAATKATTDSTTSTADSTTKTDATTTADDDWSYIKEKGTLTIGITDYKPMNYYDDSGKLVGFDTEFAEAVCKHLGITPNFVEINWDTKEIELAAKNIDCIWNGLTISEDRKENMDFSEAYILNKQQVVIKKDNADTYTDAASLAHATLVAEISSAGETAIADDAVLSGATYVAVAKQTDALLEVKAGTADAAVLDYTLANAMVGDGTDYSDLMIVKGMDLAVEQYGIGFRKGSTAVDEINKAIDALIKDGTLSTIAEKYGLSDNLIANQG